MSMNRENLKKAEQLLVWHDQLQECLDVMTNAAKKVRYVKILIGFTDVEQDKLSLKIDIPPEDAMAYISSQSNKLAAQLKALGVAL